MDDLRSGMGFEAFQEGTIELVETAEELAILKHARVVEEIVISGESFERTQVVRDIVRHTEIEIEHLDFTEKRNPVAAYDMDDGHSSG